MSASFLKGKKVLVVDDEADLRDILTSELKFLEAKPFEASNMNEALKILHSQKIDLILSDIRMPGGTGIDLLNEVNKNATSAPPLILMSGFADIKVEDAFNMGARALIHKPFNLEELLKLISESLLPIAERLKRKEETTRKKLLANKDLVPVKFGRGGVGLVFDPKINNIEVDDLFSFDFMVEGKPFKGQGMCRWIKTLESEKSESAMGVEFVNLEEEGLKTFLGIPGRDQLVPFIPQIGS